MLVFDPESLALLDEIAVPGAHGAAMAGNGKHFYTTNLPGAPDGEYVVIQYKTSFQNKASAIETVTPMRDPDGVYRVSGYYIR